MSKIRICFLLPALEGGGSERVILNLFNGLDRGRFEPTLVLFQKKGIYLQNIPADAHVEVLNIKRMRYAFVAVAKYLRRTKPDLVFSTLGHLNLLIAILKPLFPSNIKFIARESNTVSVHNKNESFPRIFDFLFRTVYQRFDRIICQCLYMKDDLVLNYDIPKDKIVVINNPLDFLHVEKKLQEAKEVLPINTFNILFVGRLAMQKRVDLLLRIIALLPENMNLYVIGKGELKADLVAQAKLLEIEQRVFFLGEQPNPYQYMAQAHCLALTSAYEGFPNVVLEAHACGTPVVAFDTPGGTGEIIKNGINGFLVPNEDLSAFADSVMAINDAGFDRNKIIEVAKIRYNLPQIVSQYEAAISGLLDK